MVTKHMRKGFLIALVCSLIAGISLSPAEAAKRKKKPRIHNVSQETPVGGTNKEIVSESVAGSRAEA